MVVDSETASIKLVDVSMEEIKSHLLNTGSMSYTQMEVIHQSDTELVLQTVYKGTNSTIHIYRETHRPMEVKVKVDFNEKFYSKDSFQISSPFDALKGALRWVFLIFTFSIAFLVFALLVGFLNIQTGGFGLLLIIILLFTLMLRQMSPSKRVHKKDLQHSELQNFLHSLESNLEEINSANDEVIKKCWNCFKDVGASDNVCAYCGKLQR